MTPARTRGYDPTMAESPARRSKGTRSPKGRSANGRASHAAAKAAKATAPAPNPPKAAKPTTYFGSLDPHGPLPNAFGESVKALEEHLGIPVWMLVQDPNVKPIGLYGPLLHKIIGARDELAGDGHVALLLESPGGLAEVAYRIARILQRDGGFTVVIPRYAKSAATLLSLGASRAIMGEDAEIGPLDAQLWDEEREEPGSALNEVQALDQLHSVALQHLDRTMFALVGATKKKTEILLPIAAKFVSDMMSPMLEKIDAVHYAKQARILAVAEHYAVRLLQLAGCPEERATTVADWLVNRYPEHGFVIDRQEAESKSLLPLINPSDPVNDLVKEIDRALHAQPVAAFGRLKEN
jgi:hypothetical protein